MNIGEISRLSGIHPETIRFYERQGLIFPTLRANGVRDYTPADLQKLLRVKLLRALSLPLAEVQALDDKQRQLTDVLRQHLQADPAEAVSSSSERSVLQKLLDDGASFANFDAVPYLAELAAPQGASEPLPAPFCEEAAVALEPFPWRRFFARMFDLHLYASLLYLIRMLVFKVSIPQSTHIVFQMIQFFAALLLMLLVEPALLHAFGTTPGKAILGIRIHRRAGGRLSYGEGLDRTWTVIALGLGYGLPVYAQYRLWVSYKISKAGDSQLWDDVPEPLLKDRRAGRAAGYVAALAVVILATVSAVFLQLRPPHRGDLTVAQFAANANHYIRILGVDAAVGFMGEQGQWQPHDGFTAQNFPAFQYTLNGDVVEAVSFEKDGSQSEPAGIESNRSEMLVSALALAGANNQKNFVFTLPWRLEKMISQQDFKSFEWEDGGILVRNEIQYSGYHDSGLGLLIPEDGVSGHLFKQHYSVRKVG